MINMYLVRIYMFDLYISSSGIKLLYTTAEFSTILYMLKTRVFCTLHHKMLKTNTFLHVPSQNHQ